MSALQQVTKDLGLDEVAQRVMKELAHASSLLRHRVGDSPIAVLLTLQTNDFGEFLDDVQHLRGRQAVRVARSLFEHLITVCDVLNDRELLQRYGDHGAIALERYADSEVGLRGLRSVQAKRVRHRRKKLRRWVKQPADMARARWGNTLNRSWTTVDLRARAEGHGYDYDFYALASAVLHGSAGGSVGLLRERDGLLVYRQGPALELCPIAFVEGTWFATEFYRRIAKHFETELNPLWIALDELRDLADSYTKAVTDFDDAMWSQPASPGIVVLRVLEPNGRRSWVLHDNTSHQIVEAIPPAIPSGQAAEIEDQIDLAEELGANRTEWVTIAALGAQSRPKKGASWRPGDHILPPSWRADRPLLPWDGGGSAPNPRRP